MDANGNSKANKTNGAAVGEILIDAAYTLDEVKRRFRIGDAALRHARRAGLPVRKLGNRRFVLGRDLINYLESNGNED